MLSKRVCLFLALLAVVISAVTAAQPTMFEITMRKLQEEGWRQTPNYLDWLNRQAERKHLHGRQLRDRGWRSGATVPPLSSGPSMSDINVTFYRWDSVTPPATVDWRLTPRITPIFNQYQVSPRKFHLLSVQRSTCLPAVVA